MKIFIRCDHGTKFGPGHILTQLMLVEKNLRFLEELKSNI